MSEEQQNMSAVLVGIAKSNRDLRECEISLAELDRLLHTAGGETFCRVIQMKEAFDPRTCIGSGKVKEIAAIVAENGIGLVVFDFELTPAQIRNLEEDIGSDVRVIDRSMLILDIFAYHATSGEGKLQVELAQLKYTAPRLIGKGTELSRLGGGIGTRGPGESKLESDKRHLHAKIAMLEERLREMEANRRVMRVQRDRSGLPKVALVGYTNAGKSTLLNRLTDAGVYANDQLFATLDPTTRKCELPGGEQILLTDTVGFIRKLPHHLVEAFRSTLDEVRYADLLLLVSDVTDPEVQNHIRVTEEVIASLGADGKPVLYVYNKSDLLGDVPALSPTENTVAVSAGTGTGMDLLLSRIADMLHAGSAEAEIFLPYSEQNRLSALHDSYRILSCEYEDEGVRVKAILDQKGRGLFRDSIVGGEKT